MSIVMCVSGMFPNTCRQGKGFFAEKQANPLLHLARLEKNRTLSKTRHEALTTHYPKS